VSGAGPGPSQGILDTSTVVLLRRLTDADALPDEPLITAVTLAELAVGPLVATEDDERARRQVHLQQAEADFVPLPFDASAARAFGVIAASLRRAGRKTAARTYDAMIAAGRAQPHHVLPETGWVSCWMDGPEDAPGVIELFRMQYDRYRKATAKTA